MEKLAKTSVEIDPLIAKRWSPRSFTLDKKVTREQVMAMCEAGRWAPSCFGDEPWRILVFDRKHDLEAYNKAFDLLVDWNQGWAKNCQILFLVTAYDKFLKNGNDNRFHQYDAGSACQNILLQATSMGLRGHPMGGFDEVKAKEIFSIPEDYYVISMIGVGYQDEADKLSKSYYKSEIEERKRRPIGTTFFDGSWEKGIEL
jgi:nitroreductase